MADHFSTVAAVTSFADVSIRACKGIYEVIGTWKDAPNAIQRLRRTVQGLESMSESLRLYVIEYESSKLFLEQNQLLPEAVKNELPDIDLEIKFLQGCLPPVGTQGNIRQRLKRMIDEKRIVAVVSRLDRRQPCDGRTGIQLHEHVSSIRNDLQQTETATLSQLEGARLSIARQLHDIARIGSGASAAHKTTLDSVQTLVEPISANHAAIMDRLDHLSTKMKGNEGHLWTNTALQATSVDTITRIVRAELRRVVIPSVEEYLEPYKSSYNTQLDGIRRTLDQIVSALGHSSVDELAAKQNKGKQESANVLQDLELRDDVFHHHRPPTETMYKLPEAVRRVNSNVNYVEASFYGDKDICEFLLVEGADPLATNSKGKDCVQAAQLGRSMAYGRYHSDTADYSSVIRVLHRYGCELEGILDLLLTEPILSYYGWLEDAEAELHSKEEELDSEEKLDSEEELDFEEELDSEKELALEEVLNHDFEYRLTRRYEAILKRPPNALLDWVSFPCDQGLDVNDINEFGKTRLMRHIFAIIRNKSNSPPSRNDILTVLVLCLLKVDVSIKEPRFGIQALDLLFLGSETLEIGLNTWQFSDLAYVLIRYGGADWSAKAYDGPSSLERAYDNSRLDEWLIVLLRCGISIDEIYTREIQHRHRTRYVGDGHSTAIDTDDLPTHYSETVTRRKGYQEL
ncbi:MAG: hypothetical protein M1833_005222 [Piccolia ochrophora]|nr:MAG: hypothetical protein M1833_005222 [Piccolia ochrophora]